MSHKAPSLFDWSIAGPAIGESFKKLDPRLMIKNAVMFVTMVGAVLTTVGIFPGTTGQGFIIQLALWLWFTVLFANGCDGAGSSGSNLGPTSQKLHDAIKDRVAAYRTEKGLKETDTVPADAVTASGSGLDPHISLPKSRPPAWPKPAASPRKK